MQIRLEAFATSMTNEPGERLCELLPGRRRKAKHQGCQPVPTNQMAKRDLQFVVSGLVSSGIGCEASVLKTSLSVIRSDAQNITIVFAPRQTISRRQEPTQSGMCTPCMGTAQRRGELSHII